MDLTGDTRMNNTGTNNSNADVHEVHLFDILTILSTYRKYILIFTVGMTILACIVSLLLPPKYTATTLVMPPNQSSSGSTLLSQLSGSGLSSLAGADLGIKSTGETYISLLHSRTVEESVVQRFGLMSRYHSKFMSLALKSLDGASKIAYGAKDGLITISVTDRDPKMAADIANGWVEEYRRLSSHLAITEAARRRLFFQQQVSEAQNSLSAAEEDLKKTQQATGAFQIDNQTRSLVQSAATLQADVAAKEVQIKTMSAYATDDNPQVVQAKQELAALQAQLAKLGGTDLGSGLIVPKGNVPEAEMEYYRKVRNVKYYETIFELLAKQYESAKIDEAREGAIIQVVDMATPPDRKSSPKRMLIVIVVCISSFIVACIGSLLAMWIKSIKSNPEEMRRVNALRATFR
jgi:uncharacterized protein involved in exopolysaccharide biosynthesis